jgi:hypothetical protein
MIQSTTGPHDVLLPAPKRSGSFEPDLEILASEHNCSHY